jgi:arylamine N-acetyltransferase
MWLFQHRINDEKDWQDMYCFTDVEFLPEDFEIMNYATYSRKTSWFTYRLVCTKAILHEKTGELEGCLIMNGASFKKRIGDHEEVLAICETEDERLEGLRKWFGIKFGEDEKEGIRNTVTSLKFK